MTELGVCYYPEHWPEDMWADDAARMVEIGLNWVRIGEFAWSRIEPTPGNYRFDWLDRAIAVLGQAGLKVVMSTPTATPPRWMVDRHPDMLAVDADGQVRGFGSRRHYDFSHSGYREDCVKIADILGERYGSNPHIHAWQIDNEYGCHDTTLSYSPAARAAFQDWLKAKYEAIDALNTAWGNVFWSMEYTDFAQVGCPNLTVTEPNPAHVMDFRRFSSDQVVRFNHAQVEALRRHTDVPLIHNYMGRITDFDHFSVGEDLEIASWDSYPLGFLEDRSDRDDAFRQKFARAGDPDFQAFHHDLYRAVGKGRWWIMEQQPGPVNWAPHNPIPAPGMVKLWGLEAAAHGAEVVSYFRWRQAPFAQEQMHAGLYRPDNVISDGGKEVRDLSKVIETIENMSTKPAPVAIVFDYTSQWAWETQPQDENFDYFRLCYDIYVALRRLGLSIDILPASVETLNQYQLVFIPGLFAWPDALKAAIDQTDAKIVLGPRTGSRTEHFAFPEGLPPGLDGLKVTAVDGLRADSPVTLKGGGNIQIWREALETDWDIVEQTSAGDAVRVAREHLTYWAGWPDETAALRWTREACDTAGITKSAMPNALRRRDFNGGYALINYCADVVTHDGHTVAAHNAKIVINTG
jgi:beta-galactosidase